MKKLKKILVSIVLVFLISLSQIVPVAASYSFPWTKGYSWQMTQGWHCGYYINGVCQNRAIDIGSSQNRYVVAAEDGSITNVCRGAYTANVTVEHEVDNDFVMGYFHIDINTLENNIENGSPIKKGQVLGQVKTGNFSDDCGYASGQQSTFGHIHLVFKSSAGTQGVGRVLDGWSLCNYATGCDGSTTKFANASNIVSVGESVLSANTMLITGNTVTDSRDYFAKEQIVINTSNGDVFLSPDGEEVINMRIE